MQLVLEEATQSRQRSLELEKHEYAGQLSTDLLSHASELEKLYRTLARKVESQANTDEDYASVYKDLDARQRWFEKAQAGCA